ncbi:MAG: BACON domain-containing protein [Prevotella sp.]|jgi:hypothetical protein|nr:BACON domain-containing protein [Prevotella sp.]
MKNLFLTLVVAFLTLTFFSCDDKDDTSIRLDKKSITIDAMGGMVVVNLTCNFTWAVEGVPEWITVTPSSSEYSGEVVVQLTANEDMEGRKGTLVFRCGDNIQNLEVEQLGVKDLDPFIKLDEKMMALSVFGEDKVIKLTTNTKWEVNDVPDWITVNPMSGDKSAEITIKATRYEGVQGRQAAITFTDGKIKETLTLSQVGRKDILRPPSLPIFRFNSVKFSTKFDDFEINATRLYINPAISDKIYLGNLICPDATSNTDIHEFTGYTFNPVTISTPTYVSSGEITKTYVPSLAEQNAFAKQIMDSKPSLSQDITKSDYTEYYSRKELHAIGMVNMGIKLDEVISGSSYKNADMEKECGIIYSFKRNLFSFDMDSPDDPDSLTKETIKAEDMAKGVSYVMSVSYGRIGLLVIESDYLAEDVRKAVDRVMHDGLLLEKETKIIESSNFYHIHFDNNGDLLMDSGKADVIKAYDAKTKGNMFNNWYPITFTVANIKDNATSDITYSVQLD